MRIIDISVELSADTVLWPGSERLSLERLSSFEKGDHATVSKLSLNVHSGTHVDAPLHFIPGGKSLESVDLSCFYGKAKVFRFDTAENLRLGAFTGRDINPGDIVVLAVEKNERLMRLDHFTDDYIALDLEGAIYLAGKGVKAIGINYLTIGNADVHRHLLGAGIGIVETLCLEGVEEGEYMFCALPLKLKGADGSPVRAILIREELV